jgi:hypothetical protein
VDEPEAAALKDRPDAARDVEEHERQRLSCGDSIMFEPRSGG